MATMKGWLLVFSSLLTAGPLQAQSTPREVLDWGRFEDPSGQATLKVDDSAVLVTSGKNEMSVKDTLDRMPRIVREVSGDFDVRLRVSGNFTAEYQNAVLLAFASPSEYLRIYSGLGRYSAVSVSTGIKTRGTMMKGRHHRAKTTSMWLRIQRVSGELRSYYSYDGEGWISSSSSKDIVFKDGQRASFTEPLQVMLLVHNRANTPLTVRFEQFEMTEPGEIESFSVVEDPVVAESRQLAAARKTRVNNFAVGIVGLCAAVLGWITLFSVGSMRLINGAMLVYMISMALPALKTDEFAMFGWHATLLGVCFLHATGGPANLLFAGSYLAAVIRRKLVSERPWNVVFCLGAGISLVCMLASLPLFSLQTRSLSVSLWGTPFLSPRWPAQWDLIGDGSQLTFSIGHIVWILAGVLLAIGIRRLRNEPEDSRTRRFRLFPNKSDPLDGLTNSHSAVAVATKSKGSAVATWLGMMFAAITLCLAGINYFVHYNLDFETGLIKRHGPLDELSPPAFLGSLATGLATLVCCLLGLPRKPAIAGGVFVVILLIAYKLYTPIRIYIP
jgi:regulation of enolase protein 1 (concanavalin A-like superfamily)